MAIDSSADSINKAVVLAANVVGWSLSLLSETVDGHSSTVAVDCVAHLAIGASCAILHALAARTCMYSVAAHSSSMILRTNCSSCLPTFVCHGYIDTPRSF